MKKTNGQLLKIGGSAALLGSLCCLSPIVIVLFGLGTVSTALIIGTYSWLFTTIAVLFFVTGVLVFMHRKGQCDAAGFRHHWKQILLSFLLMTVLLVLLKYVISPVLARYAYG